MAYVSQELKAKISPKVKTVLKKYGIKGTLAVRNHSTLVLNIKSGKIDFVKNYNDVTSQRPGAFGIGGREAKDSLNVNPYWYHEHFSGRALKFMKEVFAELNNGNWDKSDVMTDYFNVGWYIDVNVGKWNKPYEVTK